ncbi:hypothetical protein FOZ60_008473 [Perkinsus olseni]|uniref:Prephenate dehydratase n=1 Tax=Perkinsus olseni TaxID=32597 RepID=A0A7J6PDV9_PEROL|nr:hypothetical protein FOZ60_008473 [Perkinsus olseni]
MTALSAPILRAYRPHLTRSHLPCMRGMATHTTSHHYTIRHIGHRGSFSEIAAQSLLSLGGGRFESKFTLKGGYSSSEELLDFAPREATTEASVAAELAIAPFESSLLGPYIHIYDQLLRGGLKIFAECSQVEKHCLIGGTDETTIASIKRVYSHPWILRNSREFSDRHGFSRVEVNSTSLPLKSAICVSIKDEPSALFKALASFALRDLNITSVVLRPLAMFPSFREALPGGSQHWDYCFYIEYDAGSEECEAALVSSLRELSGPIVERLGKVREAAVIKP